MVFSFDFLVLTRKFSSIVYFAFLFRGRKQIPSFIPFNHTRKLIWNFFNAFQHFLVKSQSNFFLFLRDFLVPSLHFFINKFLVKINLTLSILVFSFSAIILVGNRRLLRIRSCTRVMFSSCRVVGRRSKHSASSTDSHLSRNCFANRKRVVSTWSFFCKFWSTFKYPLTIRYFSPKIL